MADERRRIPRTDVLLADPRLIDAQNRLGRHLVKQLVVEVQAPARRGDIPVENLADAVVAAPALAEARRQLAGTPLHGVEAVCVSGRTGAGLDTLRAALARLVAALPQPDPAAPVRFRVDRAFTIRGAGTVVTGTLPAGTLRTGEEFVLEPGGHRVRIRGMESLKKPVDSVPGVARVAINLRSVPVQQIRRGCALLTPDAWLTTTTVDIRADGLLPREALVHVGSAAVVARVRPLGAARTSRPGLSAPAADRRSALAPRPQQPKHRRSNSARCSPTSAHLPLPAAAPPSFGGANSPT